MRTKYRVKCVQRAPEQQEPIAVWAARVVADPAAHCATPRNADIVADLLHQLEAAR